MTASSSPAPRRRMATSTPPTAGRDGRCRARRPGGRPRRTPRRRPRAWSSAPTPRRAPARPGRRARPASPCSCSTRRQPASTTVYSSKSGRWPGSSQPCGERMRATLTRSSPVFTRPTNSSMRFGFVPAASIVDGPSMSSGIGRESTGGRRASTAPDGEPVGDVVGPLAGLGQRADAGEAPADDAEVERGDGQAGERAGGQLAAAREDPREDERPADRQREVDRHGGGEQRRRCGSRGAGGASRRRGRPPARPRAGRGPPRSTGRRSSLRRRAPRGPRRRSAPGSGDRPRPCAPGYPRYNPSHARATETEP